MKPKWYKFLIEDNTKQVTKIKKPKERIKVSGYNYLLEKKTKSLLPTSKTFLRTLRKGRFGKEWLIARIWFDIAKEKELRELIITLRNKEIKLNASLEKNKLTLATVHNNTKKVYKMGFLLAVKRATGMRRERALLFDDDGTHAKTVNLLPDQTRFKYNKKEFILNRDKNLSKITLNRLLEKETFYFFNIGNSGAVTIKNPQTAQHLKPDALYTLLNTEQLKKLNSVGGGLGDLFNNPKKLIIIGAVLVGAYFIFTGGLV